MSTDVREDARSRSRALLGWVLAATAALVTVPLTTGAVLAIPPTYTVCLDPPTGRV